LNTGIRYSYCRIGAALALRYAIGHVVSLIDGEEG